MLGRKHCINSYQRSNGFLSHDDKYALVQREFEGLEGY